MWNKRPPFSKTPLSLPLTHSCHTVDEPLGEPPYFELPDFPKQAKRLPEFFLTLLPLHRTSHFLLPRGQLFMFQTQLRDPFHSEAICMLIPPLFFLALCLPSAATPGELPSAHYAFLHESLSRLFCNRPTPSKMHATPY